MDKLIQMLTESGLPFAYDHFAEGESPEPPFLCYLLPGSDNFAADGAVYDEIADEIFRLRELKQQTTVDTVARDEQIKRITALQDFIRSQSADLTEFDETLVRRWFKQITVYEDHYTIELKSGLKVDIDAE